LPVQIMIKQRLQGTLTVFKLLLWLTFLVTFDHSFY
jgi:hypothetical protein